jgi:hypothetical protein
MAAVLFEAGRTLPGRVEAEKARLLDERVSPPRNLSDQQREQVRRWLGKDSTR